MSLIYVTSPIHETILSRLADLGEVRLGYGPNAVGYEEIRNQVDAVFLRGGHISAEMIAASPKLRIVARHGAGYDNVDYKAAADYGVWVTNTPGANQRSVIEHGLESQFVAEALAHHRNLLSRMADSLKDARYLAGDGFSNADCAVIPYVLRLELLKLAGMWEQYPSIADWWARMRSRQSVEATIFDRMSDADWAPFKHLSPDPWPKVQELLRAA